MDKRCAFDQYIGFNMLSEFRHFLDKEDKGLICSWLCANGTTTPIHIAANQYPYSNHSILKKLLSFSSCCSILPKVINVRDELGRTPLMIAKGLCTVRPRLYTADQLKNWKTVQKWAGTNIYLLKEAKK